MPGPQKPKQKLKAAPVPLGMAMNALWNGPPPAGAPTASRLDPAQTKALLDNLANLPQELPLSIQRYIVQNALVGIAPDVYKQALLEVLQERHLSTFSTIRARATTLEAQYQAVRQGIDLSSLGPNLPLVKFDVALVPQITPLENVRIQAGQMFGNPVQATLGVVMQKALEEGVAQLLKAVPTAAEQDALKIFASLDYTGTPAQIAQAQSFLQDKVQPVFAQLDPATAQKQLVKALQAKALETLAQAPQNIGSIILADVPAVAAAVKSVTGVVQTIIHIADTAQEFADKVGALQSAVNGSLQAIHDRVNAETSATVSTTNVDARFLMDTIQSALMGRLPTQDDIDVVLSRTQFHIPEGVINPETIPGEVQQGVRDLKAQLMQKQLALVTEVKGYLQKGDAILDFAAQVGVSPQIVATGRTLLNAGSAVSDAIGNVLSGNYLGAVAGIGNLIFGGVFGGGPDLATLRHQELLSKLSEINGKVDQLLAGQQTILKGLAVLDDKINKLFETVVKNHVEVMQTLYEIKYDELYNRSLIIEVIDGSLKVPREFLRADPNSASTLLSLQEFQNQRHEDLSTWFLSRSGDYIAVEPAVRTFTSTAQMSLYFDLEANPATQGQDVVDYRNNVVNPVLDYFQARFPAANDRGRAISTLVTPSLTLSDLQQKLTLMPNAPTTPPLLGPSIQIIFAAFNKMVNYEAVKQYIDLILRMQVLYPLIRYPDFTKLLSVEELGKPETYGSQVKAVLKDNAWPRLLVAQQLMNRAVAQQTLMSGDILLPLLSQDLQSQDQTTSDGSLKVLRGMPTMQPEEIQQNVVRYLLTQRLRENQGDLFSYKVALAVHPDPTYLTNLFKKAAAPPLKFVWQATPYLEAGQRVIRERWNIMFSDLTIPLPTPDEMEKGALRPTAGLVSLMPLRASLIEEMAAHQFKAGLTQADNTLVSVLSLIHGPARPTAA